MTPNQEDALFNFLENVTEPFGLDDVLDYIQVMDKSIRSGSLPMEVAAIIDSHHVAFRLNGKQWVSRRGCFENIPFVISPTKLELLNGILIPGHRCVPFANPARMPHEYKFFWKDKEIPVTTSEGPPEDFYPYYYIFGEEYAPQYVARDNPENESAFNCDPYEDPPEVSINTIDMRNIFREAAFVPGDRFIVRSRDWKLGYFDLEKVKKGEWSEADLYTWFEAAESGFEDSFALLGPGVSTEEQIAYAYWYGGKRMRELPAYSLEEFLSEKTDRIENVAYGIESRFWFAGKDIPDSKGLSGFAVPPDRTYIEDILYMINIPVSEYVILSYVRDALFRNDTDIDKVLDRIVPSSISLEEKEWDAIAGYIDETMGEMRKFYSIFLDQRMGPIRQQAVELHTAVIDLAARLQKGEIDSSWLPRHTFIMLSQIQAHAARLLEDLDTDEALPKAEMEAMDNSLDSMVETFREIKEMIDDAMNNFRRRNLLLIRPGRDELTDTWRAVQISIVGTEVWRRVQLPMDARLDDLHRLIQICLDWKDSYRHRFFAGGLSSGLDRKNLDDKIKINEICNQGFNDLHYEYGNKWSVNVIMLSPYQPGKDETIRCVAGEGAAPPEKISGPLRFRKILISLSGGSDSEKQAAFHEIGHDYVQDQFDMESCNKKILSIFSVEK
ncbi:MAG: plasmid pRiA4b ORF-3 family protein [Treponema sp.]|nr:plasmid pRiA4b ORF-3 family protein [Treponema sp.]